MKKIGIFLVALMLLFCLFASVSCGKGSSIFERGVWFKAEVLEVYEGGQGILVACIAEDGQTVTNDLISVNLSDVKNLPDIKAGDIVKIRHSGEIAESYPAQIFEVYEIKVIG
ncbi:MAG: hypothetical protein E7667_05725 [Ruminococcaceae bacterium]|nr:hypothetical protein [Oscillospiraceae bacterium]